MRMRDLERRLPVVSEALMAASALAAAAYLALMPVYSVTRVTREGARIGEPGLTLAAQNGAWVYGLLTVVVLVSAVPLVARHFLSARSPRLAHAVRKSAVVLLGAFVVIAGFSIGFFFAPAAIFGMVSLSPAGAPESAAAV